MTKHYYDEKPMVESDRRKITEEIAGETFHFYVDRGVFSKAGLDFGTRLLIESFELPNVEGAIGDVGCGWGPIGITLAKKFPQRKIYMYDINERAVDLAKLNAKLNNVTITKIQQNDLLHGQQDNKFASILTNPPIRAGKKVVFQLYEQAIDCLAPQGELWVVIQKKQGALSTKEKLENLGLDIEVVQKSKGYFIYKGKKC
ncbi:class I SAM-dependent methyltransferase [Evansella sp. AB-P1]|uniref:class I SAM-dependent methyltransferase n=1 Tax=Evansella sp. AB-P1 TaxID=3037653 RepID=UPI00241EBC75|nr:class I SAM-dependent methyltransferase [Evansella sp. AB-P1]MDG5788126.1 class I SAM-dependent methyltransferase [Evansella sp. AB-P1]